MGIIKRGILGGFAGKVANVVGGSWKGIGYMRALPLSVANPNTPAQQAQRGAFTQVTRFAGLLLVNILQPFWNQYAQRMSGYNLFQSRNIGFFNTAGLVDPSDLLTTIGTITPAPITGVTASAGGNDVDLTWVDNTGDGTAQATDEAIIVIFNETSGELFSVVTAINRTVAASNTILSAITLGDTMHVWLSFRDLQGKTGIPFYGTAIAGV